MATIVNSVPGGKEIDYVNAEKLKGKHWSWKDFYQLSIEEIVKKIQRTENELH